MKNVKDKVSGVTKVCMRLPGHKNYHLLSVFCMVGVVLQVLLWIISFILHNVPQKLSRA